MFCLLGISTASREQAAVRRATDTREASGGSPIAVQAPEARSAGLRVVLAC